MESPWIKFILTGLAANAYWYSLTPPNYPTTKDKLHVDGFFGFIAHKLSLASKTVVVTSLICQMIILVTTSYPSSTHSSQALSYFCHSVNPSSITSLTPTFLIGSSFVITMALIRAWCFHTLGVLFTFQITIRQEHRLVTSGPYSYVRHPGYTSLILAIIGVLVMSLDNKGWIRQCDMMDTSLRWWICAFILLCIFSIRSMITRGNLEDEELKKQFKEEWFAYSRNVPEKFIPGII